MSCSSCGRENCRVDYWMDVVAKVQRGELDMPMEDAQRGRDAAKVSCFIRSGQRQKGVGSPR
jgi:hypothetical protein